MVHANTSTREPTRYLGVRGQRNVERILAAVEESGGSILSRPDPTSAPYEIKVRTGGGEDIELVCYAFTANKYAQQGRPADEHRFQIKYGSDFTRYHPIYFDPRGRKVTLFFGVHQDIDLFIAVDPVMHDPTWFSSSVEFKTQDLDEATSTGWHGWERDRSDARRKKERPLASLQTEAVIAFRPEYFLRYVAFERAARGLDPGERLLLADRIARNLEQPSHARSLDVHPLEIELGLPARDILDIIGGAFRLKVAVRGGVAEHHLGNRLRLQPELSDVRRLDQDGQPDFSVKFQGRLFRIECKNVLRKAPAGALARVDFQKTRAAMGDKCSRYYSSNQFEVLAACLHPVTESWDFRFCPTSNLAPHPRCKGKLTSRVIVSDSWPTSLPQALDELLTSSVR